MLVANLNGICVVDSFIKTSDLKIVQEYISNCHFSEASQEKSYYCSVSENVHSLMSSWNNDIVNIIKNEYGYDVYYEDCATINKYITGWYLEEHDDLGLTNSGRQTTDFSSIIYFNSDFRGGHLQFTTKNVDIKPKAGLLVISPASDEYLHEVTPVTDGIRYTATTFWQKI